MSATKGNLFVSYGNWQRGRHMVLSRMFTFLSHIQPIKGKKLQSCEIVVCVGLELHPKFLQTDFFSE